MKKLFALVLALIVPLMLPGCGLLGKLIPKPTAPETSESEEDHDYEAYSESEYSDYENSEPEYSDGYDYSGTDTIYGQMSAAEKAALIQQAALSGTKVTFNADGSTTFVYDDGSVTAQNADGTWTYSDGDGTATTQFGGNWPDNEFTRQLPQPDFEDLFGAVTGDNTFTVLFAETDVEKMRDYIGAIKEKGFTIDAETTDETAFGFTALSYTAKNAAGYEITVTSAAGINTISITKN